MGDLWRNFEAMRVKLERDKREWEEKVKVVEEARKKMTDVDAQS